MHSQNSPSLGRKLVRFPAAVLLGLANGALSTLKSVTDLIKLTERGFIYVAHLLLSLDIISVLVILLELVVILLFAATLFLAYPQSVLFASFILCMIPDSYTMGLILCIMCAIVSCMPEIFNCLISPFKSIFDTYTDVMNHGVDSGVRNIVRTFRSIIVNIGSILTFGYTDKPAYAAQDPEESPVVLSEPRAQQESRPALSPLASFLMTDQFDDQFWSGSDVPRVVELSSDDNDRRSPSPSPSPSRRPSKQV